MNTELEILIVFAPQRFALVHARIVSCYITLLTYTFSEESENEFRTWMMRFNFRCSCQAMHRVSVVFLSEDIAFQERARVRASAFMRNAQARAKHCRSYLSRSKAWILRYVKVFPKRSISGFLDASWKEEIAICCDKIGNIAALFFRQIYDQFKQSYRVLPICFVFFRVFY